MYCRYYAPSKRPYVSRVVTACAKIAAQPPIHYGCVTAAAFMHDVNCFVPPPAGPVCQSLPLSPTQGQHGFRVMGAPRTAVHDRGRREVPGHTSTTFILHTHERLPRQEGRYQVTPTSVFTVFTMLSLCFLGPSPAAAGPDVCAAAAFWIFSSAWNARCAFRASLDVNRCSRPCDAAEGVRAGGHLRARRGEGRTGQLRCLCAQALPGRRYRVEERECRACCRRRRRRVVIRVAAGVAPHLLVGPARRENRRRPLPAHP